MGFGPARQNSNREVVFLGEDPGIASRDDAEVEMNAARKTIQDAGRNRHLGFQGRHQPELDGEFQRACRTAVDPIGTCDEPCPEVAARRMEGQVAGRAGKGQKAGVFLERGAGGERLQGQKVVEAVPHHQVNDRPAPGLRKCGSIMDAQTGRGGPVFDQGLDIERNEV